MSTDLPVDHDALVIGAGFSGLALLHHLREAGLSTHVVEATDGIGGTWWINNYPGVRTDSEFHYYSFSFSKEVREEWTWTERYPCGEEVLGYLNFMADRLDLRKDIELGMRVTRAEYDEAGNRWVVHFEDGSRQSARYLVSGMGVLSQPIYPDIPGIDTFAGERHHTAAWPRDGVDLRGKRVGIIGLGASGIQAVPVIAQQAEEFYVFQRTPNYVVETNNEKVGAEWMQHVRDHYDEIFEQAAAHPFGVAMEYAERSALEATPEERRAVFESKWKEGGFHFANECFNDLATNHESSELASEFIRSKIREIVKDPAVADLLCPKDYSFNGKRVPTGHHYYDTFNRANVHLVDVKSTPISAITESGIRVGETEYELDVIVFATGFDAMTGTLTKIDIVGRDGLVLRDKWDRDGLRSNLGISVHGFPNFFMSLGPQTPYSNLPVPIQLGAQWLQRLLVWARENDIPRLEATAASEQWWLDETNRAGEATVMCSEGEKAGAWFLGHNVPGKGRAFQVYMGGGQVYQDYCRQAELDGYASFVNDRVAAGTPAVVPA
ncbi:NAD(P)/FAD-dependent oxidoreductase [Nocardioides carbamazepini]|uniref:flavin-containing monooxygenase n=1 Tax=Nocardioides carbamazepini TaxID=2854259 RepID=UPI00214A290D|nr:NAD(P)/FAD-dependent oxidoreductase [Nocardioides carbamazepini]MCR1785260.1 NAD(P)/FAD-dependent oxidoreductase [Nocardioides carbamazepini]